MGNPRGRDPQERETPRERERRIFNHAREPGLGGERRRFWAGRWIRRWLIANRATLQKHETCHAFEVVQAGRVQVQGQKVIKQMRVIK